jgi:hypothetical protein
VGGLRPRNARPPPLFPMSRARPSHAFESRPPRNRP